MTLSQVWTAAGAVFAAVAVIVGIFLHRIRWVPRADFDILGFGWLIRNAAPISAIVIVAFCVAAALYCWGRGYWAANATPSAPGGS